MIGLKVPKKEANTIRQLLLQKQMLNLDYKIKRSRDYVYFPLTKSPNKLLDELKVQMVETDFEEVKRNFRSIEEYLQGQIPPEKMEDFKKSFDIIGSVVILEIPEELNEEKKQIGEAALKFTRRKAVYRKKSQIRGVTRTRELEHLAGEDSSETIHKEFGSQIMLDVKKVYFSPRLATERKIITDQVNDGELILDMFAGVGPFAVNIARKHDAKVYAVDINPDAMKYLKKNIKLNKVSKRIVPLQGDVKEVLQKMDLKFDRIIMNLPGSACEFLDPAIEHLKPGGVLHYYQFSRDLEDPVNKIKKAAKPLLVKILDERKVKSTKPGEWHVAVDTQIGN
ncbi:MAG TPA: class I SAM-dependent methyltransferase family protein [Methanobacteriaceae archaeon]|nr:class I SAM-dependent methyltransferase family protein [Methanobacteriaceae archaeon]